MIRTSPATIRRAAALLFAAAVLPLLAPHASAQTSIPVLAGPIADTAQDPATLSVSTVLTLGGVVQGNTATGPFGPAGYSGTVTVGGGIANTLSESFDTVGNANRYIISQTGVAGALETVVATKTFVAATNQLAANTAYSFTLTRTAASALSLLNNFNITLKDNGTPFLDTNSGLGLLGAVNLLNLFNNNNTVATFQFTTPANFSGTNLGLTFTSTLPAQAVAGQFVLTGATINQVPEPHTVVAMLLGAGGVVFLRIRRRLAAV